MSRIQEEARRTRYGVAIFTKLARSRGDLMLACLDSMLVVGAYLAMLVVRFDTNVPAPYWDTFRGFVLVAVIVHVGFNWAWGLYGQIWRQASVAEARRVVLAGMCSAVVLFLVDLAFQRRIPISVLAMGSMVATGLVGAIRFQSRLFSFHGGRQNRFSQRVLVVGAGSAGATVVREMLRDPDSSYRPVAAVDDDARTHGMRLAGIPVVGGVGSLVEVAARARAQVVVLAVPSADPRLVRAVAEASEAAGLPLKVLPRVRELLGADPSVRDVRDLRIEDLLGRKQVDTDLDAVRRLLAGQRVLVTGAGGSIGSEIVNQVAECDPELLVLLDHDETHLHDTAELLRAPAHQVLADIRDASVLEQAVRRFRPKVVFHAAAHKHVPLLEHHACEAVRTNVLGTANVLAASAAAGVDTLVFVSTDKAVRPTSVMGATKWLAEQLIVSMAPPGAGYCAVRFGNVLGSRGSVIPTFARQIKAGGPVTVTDSRMTRFFMSVGEAVQLVLQAAVFAQGREIYMLDMGEPMNILELAERMIRLSGRSVGDEIAIRIVGRRPGEKLVEDLHAPQEACHPTSHPSITRLSPVPIAATTLDEAVLDLSAMCGRNDYGRAARYLLELAAAHSAPARSIDLRVFDGDEAWSRSTT